MRNALSIDVEEYFQVGAFETILDRADWDRHESRVELSTDRILALLADRGVHATFFVLGWIAERHPALIARIAAGGHEVASHGWDHARVFTLTADSFREDLRRARGAIEDAAGTAVRGYRAPSFSIDQRTPWAHPVLAEEGYAYSSSVAPIAHDHYGWREAPRFAWHPVPGSALIELPVTTVELHGRRFAAAGGGFFRLYPYALSRWAVRRLNQNDHRRRWSISIPGKSIPANRGLPARRSSHGCGIIQDSMRWRPSSPGWSMISPGTGSMPCSRRKRHEHGDDHRTAGLAAGRSRR